MKIIHQNGFTQEELLTYRMTIYRNLVDSAQAIILAMRKIGVDCETPSNRVSREFHEQQWVGASPDTMAVFKYVEGSPAFHCFIQAC